MKRIGAFLLLILVGPITTPAIGQVTPRFDISGIWVNLPQEGGVGGGDLGAYIGFPLSEAGRLYALAWDPGRASSPQQQCPGGDPMSVVTGAKKRFWEERDPNTQRLLAIKMYNSNKEAERTIWMDGRPHPPAYAQHTFTGFSTGKYEGNVLTVYTTHIKRNWLVFNGIPISDQATLVEHFVRRDDELVYTSVLTDPVFLSEPMIRVSRLAPSGRDPGGWLYSCEHGEDILHRPKDRVPSYFFGQNTAINEYLEKSKIPMLAALGGAETLYPEFPAKLKDAAASEAAGKAKLFPAAGPPRTSRAVDPDPHDGEIHVLPVQGNVYMLVGDGGNIAVQIGDQGPLLVDTGAGKLSDKVIAAIRKLSDRPIQFIMNTSVHDDHVGGNEKLVAGGEDPDLL